MRLQGSYGFVLCFEVEEGTIFADKKSARHPGCDCVKNSVIALSVFCLVAGICVPGSLEAA